MDIIECWDDSARSLAIRAGREISLYAARPEREVYHEYRRYSNGKVERRERFRWGSSVSVGEWETVP